MILESYFLLIKCYGWVYNIIYGIKGKLGISSILLKRNISFWHEENVCVDWLANFSLNENWYNVRIWELSPTKKL
jgi:hypothetical protein